MSAEVLVCVRTFLEITNICNTCATTHMQQHERRQGGGAGEGHSPPEFSQTSLKPPEFQKLFHF